MHPPRRLGSSLKLRLRCSMGWLTALSIMNSRSSVLRAAARLTVLLIVTRTVLPGFVAVAMVANSSQKQGQNSSGGVYRDEEESQVSPEALYRTTCGN